MAEFKNLKGVNTRLASNDFLKRKMLRVFNYLQTGENLTKSLFQVEKERVRGWSKEIETLNAKIYDAWVKADIDLTRSGYLEDEEAESSYQLEVDRKLDEGEYSFTQTNLPHSSRSKNAGKEGDSSIFNLPSYILPLRLQCPKFSGRMSNKFEFKNFLAQFYNCVSSVSSDKAKLSLLKSYLTGYEAQLISHLSLEEANYEVAIKLLTEEFLDIPLILDEMFKQLLDASPKYDGNFINVKQFLSETRADSSELRTSYKLDFFEEETPGFRIISHIVFAKLPSILQKEFVHKVGTNYPTIKDTFDNYNENIKTLIKTNRKNNFNPERNNAYPSQDKTNNPKAEIKNVSALENFTTKADSIPSCCKICKKEGHPMSRCSTYACAQTRQASCRELNICTLFTSTRHKTKDCLGKRNRLPFKCSLCNLRNHVTPLCDKAEEKKEFSIVH